MLRTYVASQTGVAIAVVSRLRYEVCYAKPNRPLSVPVNPGQSTRPGAKSWPWQG